MPEPIDAYKILQVDAEAEDEVIQAAYRRLARKYHPDLTAGPEAAARMAAINAAWGLIGDPVARATYDRSRAAGLRGDAPPDRGWSQGASRPTGPQTSGGGARSTPPSPLASQLRSAQ